MKDYRFRTSLWLKAKKQKEKKGKKEKKRHMYLNEEGFTIITNTE